MAHAYRVVQVPDVWWQSDSHADTYSESHCHTDADSESDCDPHTRADSDTCAAAERSHESYRDRGLYDSGLSVVDG